MPRNKAKRYHLKNVRLGYAEVIFHGRDGKECYVGYVKTDEVPSVTDFEKDEIHTVTRWLAYDRRHWHRDWNIDKAVPTGRVTGYRTRIEAIEALLNYMRGSMSVSESPYLKMSFILTGERSAKC